MTVFSIDPNGQLSPLAQFKATRFDEGTSAEILRRQDVPLATADNDPAAQDPAFPSAKAIREAVGVSIGIDLARGPDATGYSLIRDGRVAMSLKPIDVRMVDGRLVLVQPIGEAE